MSVQDTSAVIDLEYTDAGTAALLRDYFAAKSRHDAGATIAFFSDAAITYTDAPLGWAINGRSNIENGFSSAMPQWGQGKSYPTRILGSFGDGDGSAVVAFTNTPGIVGNELLHILAAVDVRDGKIVRWVDYWDSSGIDEEFRRQVRTPDDAFPLTFGEDEVPRRDRRRIDSVGSSLLDALGSGDAVAAAALFDDDGVWEDMSLRIKVVGGPAIERHFQSSRELSPHGLRSRLRHVVGDDGGGGVEWFAAPSTNVLSGITALTLTGEGKIARATTVYDARLLASATRETLITLATRP